MELDLGLSLSPHTKSSKLGFDFDLNKNSVIGGGVASCLDTQKLRLFALNDKPNEEDEDPLESDFSTDYNEEDSNEILGWPPLKSCMIIHNYRHRNHHRYPYHHHRRRNNNISNPTAIIGSSSSSSSPLSSRSSMYVKVKMDGVAIARKVNIKLFNSYDSLTNSLISMFTQYEGCDRDQDTNYTFIFQGKEGDSVIPGDVSWKNFTESVHRITITRDRSCAYTRCLF